MPWRRRERLNEGGVDPREEGGVRTETANRERIIRTYNKVLPISRTMAFGKSA